MKAWLLRLAPAVLKYAGLAAGVWFAVEWFSGKFESAGYEAARTEQAIAGLEVLRSELEEARESREALVAALAERRSEVDGLRATFDELRAEAREIQDACTAAELPAGFVDGLRAGAEAARR